ncbi:putative RNA-binding Zn ribbon-like protein [Allocatelliglobosispora scoriae]|uniref:Putative RNA-binding Zn ribbon-like protein n=1 Tax=Allocatelliglobosispora scoriae TaxID=643052 RepID=A0A841BKA8_9ACTN|nr:CGNR zinc finger domain-containing protein [Allocatelliglobosispora scoriae]MBB5867619.1 putative RNA-binding Zn ribbon-like protein [Allocatelliglobosispora scoriae]
MSTPQQLAVVADFLNTLDLRSYVRHGRRHHGGDALITPGDLTRWLVEHHLINHRSRAHLNDLELGQELREALRVAMRLRAGDGVPGPDLFEVNGALERLPLRVACDSDGTPGLVPEADGVPGALALVAAAAVRAQWSGSWARLKECAAEDCRWVFYDSSRNGGGRWCSMEACGNRDKIRTYRARQAA